ncbi:MAG TPA: hypothetical protein VLA49_18295 [Anaerolineales bacterium]|nr:hypothetical protein [Anaerolineales bacterium]
MIQRKLILLTLLAIALAACTSLVRNASTPQPDAPPDTTTSDEPGSGGGVNSSPLDPIEGEDSMVRGEAFVDSAELLILESYPLQIRLMVNGTLPTPCHQLRASLDEPDEQGRIYVELYSLVDPQEICIQVLESFETNISLGSYPDGSYTVWLNSEQVGEFSQ